MKQLDWYLKSFINEPWAYTDRGFTSSECDSIIATFSDEVEKARISNNKKVNETRDSNVHFIDSTNEDNHWIFKRLSTIVMQLNNQFFNFDIDRIEAVQFTEYDSSYKGFYKSHVDTAYETSTFRKLSFSIQLTDENEYEGGNLIFHTSHNPQTAPKTKGSLSIFPSFLLHEVTPVTNGTRYALVGWVLGDRFK